MNWKKWIKYTAIALAILLISSFVYMSRVGTRMYGGLTTKVDHTQFKPAEGKFAIRNVSILSLDGDSLISNQTVLIENGLIIAIDSNLNILPGTAEIDGMGKYLIPGLIDTHVHLFQSPNDLLLYLANGVTEIQELIGEDSHLQWKREVEDGRVGPKMHVASPRLGSFEKLEGWFMSWSQGYMNIQDASQGREAVQRLHEQGYDGIKIYSQLNRESYMAITETAKSLDMRVMGHVPWELTLQDIWENGQSGIAHFEELMNALSREFDSNGRRIGSFKGREDEFLQFIETRSDALAKDLIDNEVAVTSTLWLTKSFARQPFDLKAVLEEVELEYENPGISEWVEFIPQGLGWLPSVNRYKLPANQTEEGRAASVKYWDTYAKACELLAHYLSERGVKIVTGTDANLPLAVPGFSLHDELGSLNDAGMSNAQVLLAATALPAQWLGSNSGKIAVGYDANLVLLEKNPLEDISNTKVINTVIAKGKVYNRALLDQMLAAVKAANDESRDVNIDAFIE